jgi:hypothetical protein
MLAMGIVRLINSRVTITFDVFVFSLPGGAVVGSRNYEHMSRGWWVLDDYGTNPTHEPTENRR